MTPRVLGAIGRKAAWLARGPWPDGRLLPPARGPAGAERTGQTPEATDEGRTPMTPRVPRADRWEAGRLLPRERRPGGRLLASPRGPAGAEGTGQTPGATDKEGTA
jgi:hypothetical protein